jgi:hypothetical protein
MDLPKFSKMLSDRLGEPVEIVKSDLHSSGYRSDGYKLTASDGRQFFLKHIREADCMAGGFETPERRLNSLLLGHRMNLRAEGTPRSLGVWVDSGAAPFMMPDITEDAAVYQLQEFEPEGVSYNDLLGERSAKATVDDADRKELATVIDYITGIHAIRYPSDDERKRTDVYNDSLLARLASPELTFAFLQRFPDDDPVLPPEKHGEYVSLALQTVRSWRNRADRLTALQGDFWSGNVFFRTDGSLWAVDYSFVSWGDPGLDIGHWIAQFIWHYHRTGNTYYKELVEEFLTLYEKKTGDTEIRQALCIGLAMMAIVFIAPGIIPDNDDVERKRKVYENATACLKEGKLVWYD